MARPIPEADRKLFRQVRELALERFCRRVLAEVAELSDDPQKSSHERYLAVLRGEIVRLTGLMSDLLDFGRPSRPDFSECRLEEVVEAAVSACGPLARRKSVEIEWPRRVGLPPVLADRARVSQVLQNLIENAVHFSPPGGRVEVSLAAVSGFLITCLGVIFWMFRTGYRLKQ